MKVISVRTHNFRHIFSRKTLSNGDLVKDIKRQILSVKDLLKNMVIAGSQSRLLSSDSVSFRFELATTKLAESFVS